MALTVGLGSIAGDYTFETSGVMGADQISLGDMLSNPTQAIPQLQSNLMNNYQAILVGSFFTALSFKVARKVLAKPIRKINAGLFGKRGVIGHIGFKL